MARTERRADAATEPQEEEREAAELGTEPAEPAPEVTGAAAAEREPTDGEAEAEAAVERDLDELVADLRRERDEYLQLAQRARADFENYRRRAARDTQAAEVRGKAALVRSLLPAVDNLERALQAAGVGTPAADGNPERGDGEGGPVSREVSAHEALAEGVALIHRELAAALEAAGIEAFDPRGESFDPSQHEAISTRPPSDGEASGVIVETLQRGYRLGDTLVRPARVVVTG